MRGGAPLGVRLAGMVAAVDLDVMRPHASGKVYGAGNIKRMLQRHGRSRQTGYFNPRINAWTGEPHEHLRERARRERQAGRDDHNQMVRAQLERPVGSPVTHVSRRGYDLASLSA